MKVWIDQDLCTGDGLCEEIAPDVFTLLDDGLAYVKEGDKVFSDPGSGAPRAWPTIPDGQLEAVDRVRRGVPRRVHLHRALRARTRRRLTASRSCRARGDLEPAGRGEEAGVGDHAVVGADGLALDVPAAVEHLEGLGHVEAHWPRAPRAAGPPG